MHIKCLVYRAKCTNILIRNSSKEHKMVQILMDPSVTIFETGLDEFVEGFGCFLACHRFECSSKFGCFVSPLPELGFGLVEGC